jgi:hypothetical protein
MQEEVLVKFLRLFPSLALVAAFSATLIAQPAPSTGFHTVACIKVKPENNTEFRKWAAGDVHKFAQSRVDSGALSSWFVLRSIAPAGRSATCDYVVVSMYPGVPPQPLGPEELDAALKKAGITQTAQQYTDRRTSLTTLISNNIFQNQDSVGTFKTGDYFRVNYMKVQDANLEDYVAYEKKVWKPFAEAMTKDGVARGWSLNLRFLPGGTDQPYQAVTVDVFPSWESIFKDDGQFVERFRKVHPDMELGTTFEHYEKLRTLINIELYVVQDLISSSK